MSILKHLDKNNLHHAYLIEGTRSEIIPELLKFIENLGIKTLGNADFIHISLDSFKIDDARNLKSYGAERGFSSEKKIFIITANSFLLEAQNSLLKMFEEPIENTHFFIILPDINSLLKTFISRFYLIFARQGLDEDTDADKFLSMFLLARINFMKDFLTEEDEDEEKVEIDSTRAKSLRFLNALEFSLHQKFMSRTILETGFFKHIFKVREFLRMPGSSTKSLMESVALIVPNF